MPLCLGTSGLVRASRMPQSLCWAPEFHTFCPSTTNSSPSRTARVRTPARNSASSRESSKSMGSLSGGETFGDLLEEHDGADRERVAHRHLAPAEGGAHVGDDLVEVVGLD